VSLARYMLSSLVKKQWRWVPFTRESHHIPYVALRATSCTVFDVHRSNGPKLDPSTDMPLFVSAYFISFGPHGPRKPITVKGQGVKTFTGVSACVLATVGVFYGLRHFFANPEQPRTMTQEYQEAMTERAKENNQNPITGISSEGYKGKGHIQAGH
jgi:Cytochrome c oxidase subunit IV